MPLAKKPLPPKRAVEGSRIKMQNTLASYRKTKQFKETHRPYKKIIGTRQF